MERRSSEIQKEKGLKARERVNVILAHALIITGLVITFINN